MNIAVVGLGKLGLPLACLQAERFRVFGIDSNPETVKSVNRGVSPINEPGVELLLKQGISSGNLTASQDYSAVADCDISLIIVPTPSQEDGSFTSKYVVDALQGIGRELQGTTRSHVVVICSTVMPGECETTLRDALEEASDIPLGRQLQLVYSPEFIALGSVLNDMRDPDMTIIGCQQQWAAREYYGILPPVAQTKPIHFMSLTSAEIAKISLNAYVTMKISFANQLSELCESYPGASASMIAGAIGDDARVGPKYISPGGPYGGPCFPRDNRAFIRAGAKVGMSLRLPQAVDRINDWQITRIIAEVQERDRPIVGILGVTYKPGAPVIEESFGTKLANAFPNRKVRVWDPLYRRPKISPYPDNVTWQMDAEACIGNDVTTILTNPDPEIIKHLPTAFEVATRSNSVVIDPWACIPYGPWHDSHIVTFGEGT